MVSTFCVNSFPDGYRTYIVDVKICPYIDVWVKDGFADTIVMRNPGAELEAACIAFIVCV